jgi:regulator of chromosome condensation
VYAWGCNDYGQCGSGNDKPSAIIFGPRSVNFDSYFKPKISQIDCGADHTAFLDEIGRLFMCGRGQHGQLGLGSYADEPAPVYV